MLFVQAWDVEFFGSVLHLRGPDTIPQPAIDDDGNSMSFTAVGIDNGHGNGLNTQGTCCSGMVKCLEGLKFVLA